MDGHARSRARKRTVIAALAAGLLIVLFLAGLTFANTIGAARVADNAASLHWANTASGVSALTRAALAQAVTYSGLHSRGLADEADVAFAMEQVDRAIAELASLEESATPGPTLTALARYRETAQRTRDAVESSDATAAHDALVDVDRVYLGLSERLGADQDAIQDSIAANTEAAARVNAYLVFLLTLAIPAAAVLVYWRIARRQMGEQRVRAALELEAERDVSRAKDSFIAGLSHELRTPLTSVYGFAEILSEGAAEDPDQVRELARIIADESAELTRMVDDLLVASRLESTGVEIDMSPTKLARVVESALEPVRRADVEVVWSPGSQMVHTDAARLRQVLVNLLSNAVRHGSAPVGIEVSAVGDSVEVVVWDYGPGVADDRVERLFDRFAHMGSTPLLTGSVGLGLAVASRLARKLGGSLDYRRVEGRTCFLVTLPGYEPDERTGDDHDAAGEDSVLATPRGRAVSS